MSPGRARLWSRCTGRWARAWCSTTRASSARALPARLLVLPEDAPAPTDSLAWIAETLSPRVAVSMMAQYSPIHRAASNDRYARINRSITAAEWQEALDALEANGLENGFEQ